MSSTLDKKTLLKLIVKILFFSGLIGLFIYVMSNIKNPDQSTIIDRTITYTTITETNTIPMDIKPSSEEVVSSISKYVTVPEGGLDWKILAKTKSFAYSFTDEEGEEIHGVKPGFLPSLINLDGQSITMQGYMFPLNAAEDQPMFLFGPFPISCPYHYHVGPALVIETHATEEIEFKLEPITLKGTLELIPRDDEYSVFYRLKDATLLK